MSLLLNYQAALRFSFISWLRNEPALGLHGEGLSGVSVVECGVRGSGVGGRGPGYSDVARRVKITFQRRLAYLSLANLTLVSELCVYIKIYSDSLKTRLPYVFDVLFDFSHQMTFISKHFNEL